MISVSAAALAVFPTPVGVFLGALTQIMDSTGLPHARGGVSDSANIYINPEESSPRPWGCFSLWSIMTITKTVFPTPVGVFLVRFYKLIVYLSLPHARGGVSRAELRRGFEGASSPRPWGCFPNPVNGKHMVTVFPTPVGVFPR